MTYRALLFAVEGSDLSAATIFVDEVPTDFIFGDDFETGGTLEWSVTVP